MNELAGLILSHTVIGMQKRLDGPDSVLCLCGEQREGVSAHAEHADHLAEVLAKAGYKLHGDVREFEVHDLVEITEGAYEGVRGKIIGWFRNTAGYLIYEVQFPGGRYSYHAKALRKV